MTKKKKKKKQGPLIIDPAENRGGGRLMPRPIGCGALRTDGNGVVIVIIII